MSNNSNNGVSALIASVVEELTQNAEQDLVTPAFLPDREAVIEIVETLRKVLFPGFFGKLGGDTENLKYYTGLQLFEVHRKLKKQVSRAILHESCDPQMNMTTSTAMAEDIVNRFFKQIPALRQVLYTDIDATLDGDPAASSKQEIIFAYPGLYAISIFRMAHELFLLKAPLIPRIMTEYAHGLTGIDIHPGATIGHHFFIDHGTGIVVGETTEIGNYVKIYQGVTLGALSTRGGQSIKGKKRHPTLEDEVTVYSSTSILGGETVIGKGAVIGSNVFITRSVAEGTRVSIKMPELDIRAIKEH